MKKIVFLLLVGWLLLALASCKNACRRDVVIRVKNGALEVTPPNIITGNCKRLEIRFKAKSGVRWRVDFADPTPCDGNVKTFQSGGNATCRISNAQNVKDNLQFTVSSEPNPPVKVFVCRGAACGP